MSAPLENTAPIGIVGAGVMGRGIAQLFTQSGRTVRIFDSRGETVEQAVAFVSHMLGRATAKGTLTAVQQAAAVARLHPCTSLAGLAGCELIIEAVAESLEIKRRLFAELESVAGESALLASNTSSLLIAEIAAGCQHPERVIGLHFFNPVPLMRVAEIIPGIRTEPRQVTRLADIVAATGHRPVIAADQPGFLVNHAGRGLYTEGLRIVEEGVASPVEVDQVLRESCGLRMGPFELLDLTGLDVSGPVMESIYNQFFHEPRFRPSALIRPRVAAGLFGRKSGTGFYHYPDQKHLDPPEEPPQIPAGARVWVDPTDDVDGRTAARLAASGVPLASAADSRTTVILIQPWGHDATHTCVQRGLDATRCVALDPLTPADSRRTLMLTAATSGTALKSARALLGADGVPISVINDSCGFIAQRVIATIVNVSCNIVQQRIATVSDLETAIPLALGYPQGPLSWGDRIGAARILCILERMLALTGEARYRASPWLRRRAQLGLSLITPETARMPE
jgi:3-hydroxybutyryl-CoA dehydrogenase